MRAKLNSRSSDRNEYLLGLTGRVAAEFNAMDEITGKVLYAQTAKYDVTEINVFNADGIIEETTHPAFLGYNMGSGAQSAEFMVLLQG